MEGVLGEVRMFAGNFAPTGWELCHGQVISIAQNQALFSLLGTMYGGDGRETFQLPDLRERFPSGAKDNNSLGMTGGTTEVRTIGRPVGIKMPKDSEKADTQTINTAQDQEIPTVPPFLLMNFIICTSGSFPSRQ